MWKGSCNLFGTCTDRSLQPNPMGLMSLELMLWWCDGFYRWHKLQHRAQPGHHWRWWEWRPGTGASAGVPVPVGWCRPLAVREMGVCCEWEGGNYQIHQYPVPFPASVHLPESTWTCTSKIPYHEFLSSVSFTGKSSHCLFFLEGQQKGLRFLFSSQTWGGLPLSSSVFSPPKFLFTFCCQSHGDGLYHVPVIQWWAEDLFSALPVYPGRWDSSLFFQRRQDHLYDPPSCCSGRG